MGTVMEILHINAPNQRRLRLDKGLSDALADYTRNRWPAGTAKAAATEWKLTLDEARHMVAGRASKTTIEKIFKRGGLLVALPIIEEVAGQTVSQLIREVEDEHEAQGRRIAEVGRGLRVLAGNRSFASPGDAGEHDVGTEHPADRRSGGRG